MALVRCSHCNKEVNNKKDNCLWCGKPLSKELKDIKEKEVVKTFDQMGQELDPIVLEGDESIEEIVKILLTYEISDEREYSPSDTMLPQIVIVKFQMDLDSYNYPFTFFDLLYSKNGLYNAVTEAAADKIGVFLSVREHEREGTSDWESRYLSKEKSDATGCFGLFLILIICSVISIF